MARGTKDQDRGSDRTKVRVFYAEVDGSNQSVQEMMRALTTAMGRSPQIMGPQRLLRAGQPSDGDGAGAHAPESELLEDAQLDDAQSDVVGAEPAANTTRRRRGEGSRSDRNAKISPVADLDFVRAGKVGLKTFFADKAPGSDLEQVLVLGHYLQNTMGLSAFGPGHILSAFKHVGKPVPVDLRQTIRNMKKAKVWVSFSDIEAIRLTTQGDNFVEHDLPKLAAGSQAGAK